MDAISYSYADKQAKRIKKFNENPDSTSGILTQPSVIQTGETVNIPAGRTAIMANTVIDGTITLDGTMFIPSGATTDDIDAQLALKAPLTSAALVNPTINGIAQSGYTGFKNLIINGRKQVNQSGLTTTDNSYNYDNHYKVGNNWFMFIDGKNIVSGEPYTLSWVGAATASYYIGTAGALSINAQAFTPITNGTTINPTITSSQILWIKFGSDSSGSTYNKVQLEPGTVKTPYEQRIYELEESFVQSCLRTLSMSFDGGSIGAGIIYSESNAINNMRANPIIAPTFGSSGPVSSATVIYTGGRVVLYFLSTGSGGFALSSAITLDARPY